MGLGGTAKKIQKLADTAETLYAKMNELTSELRDLRSDVETTAERVDRVEGKLTRQRALLEAVAAEQGIDTDAVIESAGAADTGAAGTASEPGETSKGADRTSGSGGDRLDGESGAETEDGSGTGAETGTG